MDKKRIIDALEANNEYVQHVLLGVVLAHFIKPEIIINPRITFDNGALDLKNYAKEFLKNPKDEVRLSKTITRILTSGVVSSFEAAKAYYRSKKVWEECKENENMYLVAGLIRTMAAHNHVWKIDRKIENRIPVEFEGLCIKQDFKNRKAQIADLLNINVVNLLNKIKLDIENN